MCLCRGFCAVVFFTEDGDIPREILLISTEPLSCAVLLNDVVVVLERSTTNNTTTLVCYSSNNSVRWQRNSVVDDISNIIDFNYCTRMACVVQSGRILVITGERYLDAVMVIDASLCGTSAGMTNTTTSSTARTTSSTSSAIEN